MDRFKNLVLGTSEEVPANVVAPHGGMMAGRVNAGANKPSTPVAKVQPVPTESDKKTETAPAPDLSAPHGGMMAGRVNAGAGVKGNTVEATTETGTGTETQQRYKPIILPHLDKTQEEKTLEGYINQIKQMTPEEKEKALKKAKRKALFSALGDGINAMANIFGTSHGSTYIPQVSLTENQKKRWEDRMGKIKENEQKRAHYERERAKLADNRNLKNMDIDLKNEQSRRDADMANLDYTIKQYGADSAQAQAMIDQLKLLYTPQELQAEIDEINSRVEFNQAKTTTEGEKVKTEKSKQTANYASANKDNKTAENIAKGKVYQIVDDEGNVVEIDKGKFDINYPVLYDKMLQEGTIPYPLLGANRSASDKKSLVLENLGRAKDSKEYFYMLSADEIYNDEED